MLATQVADATDRCRHSVPLASLHLHARIARVARRRGGRVERQGAHEFVAGLRQAQRDVELDQEFRARRVDLDEIGRDQRGEDVAGVSAPRLQADARLGMKAAELLPAGRRLVIRGGLKDDLAENLPPSPPLLLVTDLCRTHTEIETIFQLAPEEFGGRPGDEIYAQVGVTTELGEGPPFFFLADLLTSEKPPDLRNPSGLDVLQRAARFLLDHEKPAHTYYQLRIRVQPMQIAPEEPAPEEGFPRAYAQVGVTTLLWETPWIFDSHG